MAEHAETLKKLLDFIETEVETLKPPTTSPYIYKVSKELCNGHGDFFKPKSIPIGPLHYNSKSPAQEFKKWFLKNFIDRLKPLKVTKNDIAQRMISLGSHIRKCYRDVDEKVITDDKFVEIMLLDGCFIMELLLSQEYKESNNTSVLVGNTEKIPFYTLRQDLLRLENQLPFLVLRDLADLAVPNKNNENQESSSYLFDLVLNFFNISKSENFTLTNYNPKHLLELVMNALFHKNEDSFSKRVSIRSTQVNNDRKSSLDMAKSASILEMYGIDFKPGDPTNLTKIEFDKGVLVIPQLVIQESTSSLFWNFLIHDMSSSTSTSKIFTSYAVLMDTLINCEKDVEVLLRKKILVSKNNDIASLVSLFNDLCANVSPQDFYFEPLVQKLNQDCRSTPRKIRKYLVQNYYEARWSVLSNIFLFVFTVTQTLFAVISYKPKGT